MENIGARGRGLEVVRLIWVKVYAGIKASSRTSILAYHILAYPILPYPILAQPPY